MKRIVGDRLVNYIDQGVEDMRPRQELPPVYIRNGAMYLTSRESFMTTRSLVGDHVMPYVMPEERSVNIDARKDLLYADYLLSSGMTN
jgi:CMP-N-acetylneuraminic acid synthetase